MTRRKKKKMNLKAWDDHDEKYSKGENQISSVNFVADRDIGFQELMGFRNKWIHHLGLHPQLEKARHHAHDSTRNTGVGLGENVRGRELIIGDNRVTEDSEDLLVGEELAALLGAAGPAGNKLLAQEVRGGGNNGVDVLETVDLGDGLARENVLRLKTLAKSLLVRIGKLRINLGELNVLLGLMLGGNVDGLLDLLHVLPELGDSAHETLALAAPLVDCFQCFNLSLRSPSSIKKCRKRRSWLCNR